MSGTIELENHEGEVEGGVLVGGGDNVRRMPVFTPRGTVSASSLSYFVCFFFNKPSHSSLSPSIGHTILKSI